MSNWNNPDELEILCECGDEEPDHEHGREGVEEWTVCHGKADCPCDEWRPRDSHWYEEQADDAATARWEERTGR